MAGIPKEHNELYFDKLCRTQKSETVLSLIQATYHAKQSNSNNIKEEIAKRLESAYNLFRDNVKNQNSGSGSYNGSMKQFESQYTIGHELCIWKNSDLDLTDLALDVAKNNITIKDYFDIFFLNYFQPISGKGVHPLYQILKYMVEHNLNSIKKSDIPLILGVSANLESINALCNFLDGTNYFIYNGEELIYKYKKCTVEELKDRCNIKYIGEDGLKLAYEELDNDDKYAAYITDASAERAISKLVEYSPEWFHQKGQLLLNYDSDALPFYTTFHNDFNRNILVNLDGEELLKELFLCGNRTNMSYLLEFEPNYYRLFGSIKGGNAFKYPLHIDSKTGSWVTGTQKNPKYLSQDEAITYGKHIRDLLVKSLDLVEENKSLLNTVEGYIELSRKLDESVSEIMGSIWFSKYLHLMFPDLFPVFHNRDWQDKVLNIIGEETDERSFCRIGKIEVFAHKCDISNVVFSQVIYQFCKDSNKSSEENDIVEEYKNKTISVFNFNSSSITDGKNLIVYGTPGCGKSYYVEHTLLKDYLSENKIRTTFFADYTNTDFVGQILPIVEGEKVTYKFNPGPFTLALEKAIRYPEQRVALVIEELNRGSAASIFGDIFQLLDRKNGVSEYPIKNINIIDYLNLKFADNYKFDEIRIPGNLSIFATMNTSDQNVFTLDTAFKRRWEFKKLLNEFKPEHEFKDEYIPGANVTWQQLVEGINDYMLSLPDNYNNEDKQIGVYFVDETGMRKEKVDVSKPEDVEKFAYKVLEYLWDDVSKFDRNPWFNKNIKSLDQLVKEYVNKGIEVFNGDLKKKIEGNEE